MNNYENNNGVHNSSREEKEAKYSSILWTFRPILGSLEMCANISLPWWPTFVWCESV